LRNIDTIYDIARSSKDFSTGINFSEIFWFTEEAQVADEEAQGSERLAVARAGGGQRDEQLKRAGGV